MATCLYKSFFRNILQPPVAVCQSKPYVRCNKNYLPFLYITTKNAPVHIAQGLVVYLVALMLTALLFAEFALEFDAQTAFTL